MEFANIYLVIGLVLASFRKFSHAEKYKLHEVKSITPIHAGGKIKYLEEHPTADMAGIPEGQRMEMCLTALEHFQDEHPSRISKLKKDEQPSEMKPYFIVQSILGGLMSHYEVLPAYECPVLPPMFIHLAINVRKNEQVFEIMFAEPKPRTKLDHFETFHMLIAKDMYDADAEKIESMEGADINTSLYDFDHQLDERQRYRLCERASMIIPTEQPFQIFENQPTGRSEFKIIKVKFTHQRENVDDEILMQLFDCPTSPKIHVHIDGSRLEKNLWTVVKETDLDQPPSHKIVQYDLMSVPEIEIHENAGIEEEKELIEKKREEQVKFSNIVRSKEVAPYVISRELEKLDFNVLMKRRKVIVEAAIDTDSELTEEERYSICAKAIKIFSGKEAALEWSDSTKPTHKHYYSIESKTGDAATELDIVNAYPCPTKDGVFEGQILVHIGSLPDKNRAVTLITGDADAKRLTSEFY